MAENRRKRFIIFGGAGFLGQHLTKTILDELPDSKILILDLKPNALPFLSFENDNRVEYRYGRDVTNPSTFENDFREGADAVFNLAGYISFWLRERKKMMSVNVEGVRSLCETALHTGINKIIHVSSVAAIGFSDDPDFEADETMRFDGYKFRNRIYMLSKHLGEKKALSYTDKSMEVVAVNPGLLYGPGENGAILTLFRNIATGRLKFYPTGGTGVVDVRDAARGILLAFLKGKSGERYILNGHNLTFQETTAAISKTLGKEPLSKPVPRISRIPLGFFLSVTERYMRKPPDLTAESFEFCFRYRYYSSAKARKELGWEPQISFERTIGDSAAWYGEKDLLN